MNLNPAPRQRNQNAGSQALFTQQCALCDSHRMTGSFLSSHPGTFESALWVCDDCQHKLARRIDDEGALGG